MIDRKGQGDFLLYSAAVEIGGVKREEDDSIEAVEAFPAVSEVKYVVSLDFVHGLSVDCFMSCLKKLPSCHNYDEFLIIITCIKLS